MTLKEQAMNKRQERILAVMRQLGNCVLVQHHKTAAWYVKGYWPTAVRLKATCRDVHGLIMMGKIERDALARQTGRRLIG